jgi:hypothetical protein
MMMAVSIMAVGVTLAANHAAAAPRTPPGPPRPLACEAPDEIEVGQPLVVRCTAPPPDKVPVVMQLHFRQPGHQRFTTAPTVRTREGWYSASLRGESVGAGPVHYYVEARDNRGELVATSGDEFSPHVLSVIGRSRPRPTRARDEDDPLAHIRVEREAARNSAENVGRRRPGSPFLGLGIGWGYGWHPAGALDLRRDLAAGAGAGSAGRVVLSPEVGYQLSDAVSLALQVRVQLFGDSGSADDTLGAPARGAWALLVRGNYHLGTGRAQLVASGVLGAGEGFRLVVERQPQAGLRSDDSVTAGPVVLGPGLGALYHLGHHAALVADLRVLAGLPRFAAVAELSSGMAIAF